MLSAYLLSELSLSSHQVWTLTCVMGKFFALIKSVCLQTLAEQLLQHDVLLEKGSPNPLAFTISWWMSRMWADVGSSTSSELLEACGEPGLLAQPPGHSCWVVAHKWCLGLVSAQGWTCYSAETKVSALMGSYANPYDLSFLKASKPLKHKRRPLRKPVKSWKIKWGDHDY